MSCYTTNTNMNAAGGGNTVYLDRHNVRCKVNYGLSMFRMYRGNGGTKLAYQMRCCTIKSKSLKIINVLRLLKLSTCSISNCLISTMECKIITKMPL